MLGLNTSCSMLVSLDTPPMGFSELKEALEVGNTERKITAVRALIAQQLSGESQAPLIMTVLKHAVPDDDHTLKRLLLLFWEVVDKTDEHGKLLPELILLCSFLRADLEHPNEFIRGVTLRFLTKVYELDILETVVPLVVSNLSHRVTYVRRNAVLAMRHIYERQPRLLPDALEHMESFIAEEEDVVARRNAFLMLTAHDLSRASRVLFKTLQERIEDCGEVLQLAIIDFVREALVENPFDVPKYIPIVFALLNTKSPSVQYACAVTLLKFSASPTAVRYAARTLIELLSTHSDSNVRLVVIERLIDMRESHADAIRESLMDIVRALSGSVELRRQLIDLSLTLLTDKNVEPFVAAMKKELAKAQSDAVGDAAEQQEYGQIIVRAIHTSAMQFPSIVSSVVPIMMDYVCEPGPTAYDVMILLREAMQSQPHTKDEIMRKFMGVFPLMNSDRVLRAALWLFGVHCHTMDQVRVVMDQLHKAMEPLPLTAYVPQNTATASDAGTTVATTTVREDGTYATNIVYTERKDISRGDTVGLRAFIVNGNYFLAAILATTLAKLTVRAFTCSASHHSKSAVQSEALAMMNELVSFGTTRATIPMDRGSLERIRLAMTIAQNPNNTFLSTLVDDSLEAYRNVRSVVGALPLAIDGEAKVRPVDTPVVFSILSDSAVTISEDVRGSDVGIATANVATDSQHSFAGTLARTMQLSGMNDAVYVEAIITVHQFDVTIEWSATNLLQDTINAVTVEFTSMGDLRVCERPLSYTLRPNQTVQARTSFKVCSAEQGVIFGSVSFERHSNERLTVILRDITIDIVDFMHPHAITVPQFRQSWTALDWEDKIVVATSIRDMAEYVRRVSDVLHMQLVEPLPADECDVLSGSLYARTVFGEDVLANVSVEQTDDGVISGTVRVRSCTNAIVSALGSKLSTAQRLF